MRALVTGNQGFLGRHFTAELQARGWEVDGCDTRDGYSGDCRNWFAWELDNPDDRTPWDLVVHAAAVVGGREVIDGDPLATAVNFELDAVMFRWAAVVRPGRVIYFSSSAAYPVSFQGSTGVPLHEDDFQLDQMIGAPDQVYGWSKVVGELLADRLEAAGVPVTVVRPFSGYGEDQDESYPFRAILERVRRREDPLAVWSATVRDFIHVDDIVAATLEAADRGISGPVNLCTGVPTPFPVLAGMMADAAGYDPAITVLDDKPTGVFYRVGDPSRLHTFYRPRITLAEGVRRALDAATL